MALFQLAGSGAKVRPRSTRQPAGSGSGSQHHSQGKRDADEWLIYGVDVHVKNKRPLSLPTFCWKTTPRKRVNPESTILRGRPSPELAFPKQGGGLKSLLFSFRFLSGFGCKPASSWQDHTRAAMHFSVHPHPDLPSPPLLGRESQGHC